MAGGRLEPLSFVLARLFEPLAARLELADRGRSAIRTALHLTTRAVHLRDAAAAGADARSEDVAYTVLLDLESHPAEAPIDRVQVRVEPTPGRVLQWTLFERAQPATEQVATLVARLTALVGDSHVGAPVLVDSWKPGAFAMGEFQAGQAGACRPRHRERRSRRWRCGHRPRSPHARGPRVPAIPSAHPGPGQRGRGAAGASHRRSAWHWRRRHRAGGRALAHVGRVVGQRARDREPGLAIDSSAWDRDEWDIAMADGTVYRLFVERPVGQWFLEGVID